jgi:hypothetical protein
MSRVPPLVVLGTLVLCGAAAGGPPPTVLPAAASQCFRSARWHAAVQTFPTSRNLTAIGRFYRGSIPEIDGWWVHFYSDRADLEHERAQLRKVLAAPFAASMVRRGDDLIGWEGPNLPTRRDRRLRDGCFPG